MQQDKQQAGGIAAVNPNLTTDMQRIAAADHHDPFAVLGRHPVAAGEQITVFAPGVSAVTLVDNRQPMERVGNTDFFRWQGQAGELPEHYQLEWTARDGQSWSGFDPYTFPPILGDMDLHLFGEGRHR